MVVASTIGRKLVMALTGQILLVFLLFHIAGNSTIFFHELNSYVAGLHALPLLVWTGRTVLLAAFLLHVWYGVVLKLENRTAKPEAYVMHPVRQATFAGRYQFWTGIAIAAFLMYHLLQFTFQVIDPSLAAAAHRDALGRPDVYTMIVQSFRQTGITALYILALVSLGMHLLHGIQSSLQTWGLTNDTTLPLIIRTGAVASTLLIIWYIAIPVAIVAGLLSI